MSASQLRTVTTGEAQPQRTILGYLRDDPRIEKGIAAVAGKYFTAEKFLSLAVNAVKKTPKLAMCEPQSVLGAFMASAALGLEPNTVQQQAFLIPYKKSAPRKDQNGRNVTGPDGKWVWDEIYECQFQVGYRGFITLAHRSPVIRSIQAEAIHAGDLFEHMVGTEAFLKYRKALKDRGDLIGAFSYVRLDGGDEMAVVLPLDEILKIRSKSETYNSLARKVEEADKQKEKQKAERNLEETPWVMWFDDMAAKSAIKKHAKQLPLTSGDPINAAAALDSGADANVIDLAAMADPDVAREVVENGYEPPALEDDPSETANFTPRTRDAETVEVRTTNTTPAKAKAEAGKPARESESSAPASEDQGYVDHNSVMASIRNAKDHEALELAGNAIQDCDPNQGNALGEAYRKRLDELDSEPSKASRRRSSNMSME
ncbi:recombinase RecT [Pusillimonas sp. SM2304]|uniref:recombinase RecT n=1 Tax=Pusillimonas sp. SM2304 TaxID=3073241 RepID=UPI0028746D4A|nr:recombinase RecT [Pusillimonas sp. SM2304]MDS1141748.1 recombinase RecT [Pusillimonas sp. SM2304]